jgi:hypothetical protein
MKIKANCKINLGLDVLRRREDGYHDLSTVMIPVKGLYDDVEVLPCDEPSSFHLRGIEIDCDPEQNICMKALRLMQQRYGIGEAKITLTKRVPFGAGLGGGSADGTMVILALNEICSLGLDEAALIDGASPFRIFWEIILPLIRAPLVTVLIICLVSFWNDLPTPLLFLGSNHQTLIVGLYNFKSSRYTTDWTMTFAGAIITILPLLIVFLAAQKQFIKGMVSGAVKG